MTRTQAVAGPAAIAFLLLMPLAARADFHLWYIKEIFSNSSGTVQYVELFTTAAGQQNLFPGHSLTSNGNSFPFPADSPSPTNNRHLLIATPGFATIPGAVTPNYTIPANFFDPNGDTIDFAGVSAHTFGPGNPLPLDGVNSLNYTSFFGASTVAVNSPRNHASSASATNSVNLPPPDGDYNGDGTVNAADYTVWRDSLGENILFGSGADGDADGVIDGGDYAFWKQRFGNVVPDDGGAGGAVTAPEPTAAALVAFAGMLALAVRKR